MNKYGEKSALLPLAWILTGTVAFALAWQLASRQWGPLLVPSLAETAESVLRLLRLPVGLDAFQHTLGRVVVALLLQAAIGIALGMAAGFYPWLEELLSPAIGILMSVPPVAVALTVIFVFGAGERQVVTTAVALGLPLLYNGAVTAVRSLDRDLLEVLRVFRVSRRAQLWAMYVPATLFALLPSILLAAGLTVRLLVMAEVIIGVEQGIGQSLSMARVHLATPEIFAWMLMMAATMLLIEGVLRYLVKRHVLAWQARR